LGLTEGYAIALPVSSEQSLSVTALALAGDSSGSGSDDSTNEGSDDSSNENSDDSTDSDSSDTSSTGSSSGGGSGGGSTGLFSLLLMGAYLLRRKMA
ncbi:GlyGly-CTERM sorting domain-containing protein, partial [Vibrio sp. PNB22_3_1]